MPTAAKRDKKEKRAKEEEEEEDKPVRVSMEQSGLEGISAKSSSSTGIGRMTSPLVLGTQAQPLMS